MLGEKTEETQVGNLKGIIEIPKEGTVTAAMGAVSEKYKRKPRNSVDLPPIANFMRILRKAGINERKLADTLVEILGATKDHVGRKGQVHSYVDYNMRLKAVELLLKYFVPAETSSENHLHLHGKKLDELLKK